MKLKANQDRKVKKQCNQSKTVQCIRARLLPTCLPFFRETFGNGAQFGSGCVYQVHYGGINFALAELGRDAINKRSGWLLSHVVIVFVPATPTNVPLVSA